MPMRTTLDNSSDTTICTPEHQECSSSLRSQTKESGEEEIPAFACMQDTSKSKVSAAPLRRWDDNGKPRKHWSNSSNCASTQEVSTVCTERRRKYTFDTPRLHQERDISNKCHVFRSRPFTVIGGTTGENVIHPLGIRTATNGVGKPQEHLFLAMLSSLPVPPPGHSTISDTPFNSTPHPLEHPSLKCSHHCQLGDIDATTYSATDDAIVVRTTTLLGCKQALKDITPYSLQNLSSVSLPPSATFQSTVKFSHGHNNKSQPPDGGWKAWSVVVGSVMIQTFAFAPTEFIFGVFVQEYLLQFPTASSSSIALIGTIGTSTTYLVGFLTGTCADRWGYRMTACSGTLIMATALVLASFSTQGILFGTGASLVYFSAIAAPTHWFKRRRGLAMGIAASGSGLGGFFLAPLTQFLVDRIGIHWTLRVLGLYCLLVCGIASLLLFEKERPEQELHIMPLDIVRTQTGLTGRLPAFSKETVFSMLVAFQFLLSMAYLTPIYFMELYSTYINISKQMGATINGWFNGASFLSRILSGHLADLVATDVVLLACIWTCAIAVLVLWTFAKTFPVYLIFAIVYGVAFSGTTTVTPVMVANYYGPSQVSSVLGIVYGFSCVALLCGSLISGQILEMTKPQINYLPVIMYSGGMFAASALFATSWILLVRRRRGAIVDYDSTPCMDKE